MPGLRSAEGNKRRCALFGIEGNVVVDSSNNTVISNKSTATATAINENGVSTISYPMMKTNKPTSQTMYAC